MPSTANNNEDLTDKESSNQEGSDSQEIVELEWSNIILFVCDLQLFEKSYLLIHAFLNENVMTSNLVYFWGQNVMKRGIYLF